MKKFLRRYIPERMILYYHFLIAQIAAIFYLYPSKQMLIIGVTGTKGKTSTCNFIWSVLSQGGYRVGMMTTANIRIMEEERINPFHMTMRGRFHLQKLLWEMKNRGCEIVVVETTSEGLKQNRHIGIFYDIAVFTNLSPEHLQSHHGSFEEYRNAKGKMFERLGKFSKMVRGKKVQSAIITNEDDNEAPYYSAFNSIEKYYFGNSSSGIYRVKNLKISLQGSNFSVGNKNYFSQIIGNFVSMNAAPAIIVGNYLNIEEQLILEGISNLRSIPGRMELINGGQNYSVLIDYAHEPKSLEAALQSCRDIASNQKLIVLTGSQGGGRDIAKREPLGRIAGEIADYVIVSTEDPYDDDQAKINEDVASGAKRTGKVVGKNLFLYIDRRAGIRKALMLADRNDIVLIAGKGSEVTMNTKTGIIPWDERKIVRDELKLLLGS